MTGVPAAALAVASVLLTARPGPSGRLSPAAPITAPSSGGAPTAPSYVLLVLFAGGALGVVAAAGVVPATPLAASLLGVAVLSVLAVLRHRSRLVRERSAACVEVALALAGELQAGRLPRDALAAAASVGGPLRPALEHAAALAALGGPGAPVLRAAGAAPGAEGARVIAAVWSVVEADGGRLADALDRTAAALDQQTALAGELAAAIAGPRSTVRLLAALPLAGILLGQALGAQPLHLLLHSEVGGALLGAAAVLDATGLAVFRLLARDQQ